MGEQPRDIGADADRDDLDLLRRRLANVIGHALRTPAATVRGQAEILARTQDEAERARIVEVLCQSSRRLEEMIDDILLVEGVETRLPTGRAESLDLSEAIHEVAEGLDVVDRVEVVGDDGSRVVAGRDALRWLLGAVLDNAGRYGTGTVRVEVAGEGPAQRLRVSSPEGGIGTTEDDRRLGFEPFYRGERAVTVTATRLGLGLTVARTLATNLGGRIHLEQDGDGTVAVLELPRP